MKKLIFLGFLSCPMLVQADYKEEESVAYQDIMKGQYQSAIYHYKKAIALRKNNPNDYLILEKLFGYLHRESESIKALEEGVNNNPNDINLLTRLAYKKELNGLYRDAKNLYDKILAIDSNNSYARSGLNRVNNLLAFNSFTEYMQTDAIGRDRSNLYDVRSDFKQKLFTQKFSQMLDGNFKIGLEYHQNTFEKEATQNHEIDESNIAISIDKKIDDLYLYLSIGQSKYDANNVGSGSTGKDDIIAGTFLANYQWSQNSSTLSYSKDYHAVDFGSYLSLDTLEVFDLQNQYSLTKNINLIGRITQGKSENLDYIIYKFSPGYTFDSIKELNVYLSFESFDNKTDANFSEYALGANYIKYWGEKFESTFWLEYGIQDTSDRKFLFGEVMNKYKLTATKAIVLTFEAANEYAQSDIETYGASLAFNLYF